MIQLAEALKPVQIARVQPRTYVVEECIKPTRAADTGHAGFHHQPFKPVDPAISHSLAARLSDAARK
jgi:hypothetical protein